MYITNRLMLQMDLAVLNFEVTVIRDRIYETVRSDWSTQEDYQQILSKLEEEEEYLNGELWRVRRKLMHCND